MQRVKYIQTDGNCRFNTNIYTVSNMKTILYNVYQANMGKFGSFKRVIGNGTIFRCGACTNNTIGYFHYVNNDQDVCCWGTDGSAWDAKVSVFHGGTAVIDGVEAQTVKPVNTPNWCIQNNQQLTIFAGRTSGGDEAANGTRLGEVKIYLGDEVLYDLIPVLDDNNVPCWYDTVSEVFTYNSGNGTPTAGPTESIWVANGNLNAVGGGTYTLTVNAVDNWTASVTKGSDFLALDTLSGSTGVTSVTLTVSANTLNERDGELTFTCGSDTWKVTVGQPTPLKYWRPIDYVGTNGAQWFVTDAIPTMDSKIEFKRTQAQRGTVGIDCCEAFLGQICRNTYSNGKWDSWNWVLRADEYYMGNTKTSFTNPGTQLDTPHIYTFDNTGISVDGGTLKPISGTLSKFDNKNYLRISYGYERAVRTSAQKIHYLKVWDNNVLTHDYAPALYKGTPCIVDKLSNKLFFAEWIPGKETTDPLTYDNNPSHVFSPSNSSLSFEPAGGEYEMTVTSDTTWQCTAATGYTISPMSGSAGTTTVTVTAPPNAGTDKIKGTSTFYDAEGYAFDLKLSTKAAGGHCEMYLGTVDLSEVKFGTYDVSKIMMGDVEVYGAGAFSGLKVSPSNTMLFNTDQGTLRIKSSESWTITDIPAWLTLSKTSGTAGTFQITMTPTQPSENRTATMTVTTANYSSTFTVDNRPVTLVDYIHNSTLKNYPEMTTSIDIGVTAKTNTMFNVKGLGKGYASSGITVGFYNGNDRADYRYFNYNNLTVFDMNALRLESNPLDYGNNKPIDVTCGNYYVTNNITGKTQAGETQAQILDTTSTLKVDMGSWWFQSLKIWEGSTLVFDGHAALDPNDVASIYDAVSDTYFTNPNLTLVAETV